MFKRLFGFIKQGFFSRWFRKIKSVFKKQPKEITPTPRSERLSISQKIKRSKQCPHADEESRKKYYEEAKKKAKKLKKKLALTESQGNILDEMITEANKGNGADLRLIKNLLDPKKLTKVRFQKLIRQYEEGKRKKRGISFMITQSNLTLLGSKRKIRNLMENRSAISKNFTAILKKYKDF